MARAAANTSAMPRKADCCSANSPPISKVTPAGSRLLSPTRRWVSLAAEPMSRPSTRAVTAIIRRPPSRLTSAWPGRMPTVAIRDRGMMWPSAAFSGAASMSAMRARVTCGDHTLTSVRIGPDCTWVDTTPDTSAVVCLEASAGSMPSRAALARSMRTSRASPATTTPFLISVRPRTSATLDATRLAVAWRMASSSPNSFTSIGCGTAVRSPIRSSMSCAVSISTPGT